MSSKSKAKKAQKQHEGPLTLVLDIETAPLAVWTWGLFDQNIGLEQIGEEWSILSFSAKWLNDKNVIFRCTGGRGVDKVRDDSELLKDLWVLLDTCDVVVGQNAKAFDLKKINARLMMKGHKPYSPVKVIDTMLIAKQQFAFTSNKLAWLSKHLTDTPKSDHKLFPSFELWAECLKDNPKAWAEMKKYNIQDIISTEALLKKVLPWSEGQVNVANYNDSEELQCPRCGSEDIQKRGVARTQTGVYTRFCCNGCGGWSRSRYTLNTPSKRKSLLVG